MNISTIRKLLVVLWKYVVGIILCQHPLGAMAVVGWTSRMMRRQILRTWWKKSIHRKEGGSFDEFVATLPGDCDSQILPNWSIAESSVSSVPLTSRRQRYFGALIANFHRGLASVLTILLFTLPATSLWLYAWVLGWNISFYKLYEQSHLGVLIGLFGIFLFGLVMLYVPIAHARHAFTGNWREFFQLRRNWQLARRYPATMLPTAIAFFIAANLVMILRIAPYFLGSSDQVAQLTTEQLRDWIDRYYLAAGALVFPAYVGVWSAVAKSYAYAVAKEHAQNRSSSRLNELEHEALVRLQLPQKAASTAHPVVQGAHTSLVRVAALGSLSLTAIAWFAIAAQVFAAQFFNYLPGIHWLNHPLVLLPWIRYIPPL